VQSAAANAALSAKVKTALLTRKGLDGANIQVEARGSAVTLQGDVVTREQAKLAEQVAKQTEGVQSVKNQLMLRVPAKASTSAS
jgi:hyperosmotically inducible protein